MQTNETKITNEMNPLDNVTCYSCNTSVPKEDCEQFSNIAKAHLWECKACKNRIWITSFYAHHYVMRRGQTIASLPMKDYTLTQAVAEVRSRFPSAWISTKTTTDEHEVKTYEQY